MGCVRQALSPVVVVLVVVAMSMTIITATQSVTDNLANILLELAAPVAPAPVAIVAAAKGYKRCHKRRVMMVLMSCVTTCVCLWLVYAHRDGCYDRILCIR